jgi:hypothetical protein
VLILIGEATKIFTIVPSMRVELIFYRVRGDCIAIMLRRLTSLISPVANQRDKEGLFSFCYIVTILAFPAKGKFEHRRAAVEPGARAIAVISLSKSGSDQIEYLRL